MTFPTSAYDDGYIEDIGEESDIALIEDVTVLVEDSVREIMGCDCSKACEDAEVGRSGGCPRCRVGLANQLSRVESGWIREKLVPSLERNIITTTFRCSNVPQCGHYWSAIVIQEREVCIFVP